MGEGTGEGAPAGAVFEAASFGGADSRRPRSPLPPGLAFTMAAGALVFGGRGFRDLPGGEGTAGQEGRGPGKSASLARRPGRLRSAADGGCDATPVENPDGGDGDGEGDPDPEADGKETA